jgi:hypothetical protein
VMKHIAVGEDPSHLELAHNGNRLYVATAVLTMLRSSTRRPIR